MKKRQKTYIDLTWPMDKDAPVYPGDRPPKLRAMPRRADGSSDHTLTTGMHIGTHIDAPLHMLSGGKKISDYPPGKFFGRGVLLDFRGRQVIDAAACPKGLIRPGDIVLVWTGWSPRQRRHGFSSHPVFSLNFASWLAAGRISIVGVDSPSPDRSPYEIHKKLLSADVLIAENLRNLASLSGKKFKVAVVPLMLPADASPCRAIAEIV